MQHKKDLSIHFDFVVGAVNQTNHVDAVFDAKQMNCLMQ
jgi:hypothetical protein